MKIVSLLMILFLFLGTGCKEEGGDDTDNEGKLFTEEDLNRKYKEGYDKGLKETTKNNPTEGDFTEEETFVSVCDRSEYMKEFLQVELNKLCDLITKEDLTGVTYIDLSQQGISSVETGDFSGLISLEVLRLDQNQIISLPVGIFDGLVEEGAVYSVLKSFSLSQNELTELPSGIFDGLSSLESLDLYNNQISTIEAGAFDGLSSLEHLYLYGNQISTLPEGIFDELSNLESLWLNENQISTLPEGIFDELSNLEKLFLYENQISTLPDGIFDGLSILEYLYLQHNKLPAAEVTRITNEVDALGLYSFAIHNQSPD